MTDPDKVLLTWLDYCLATRGHSLAELGFELGLAPSTVLRLIHDPRRLGDRPDLMLRISAAYQVAVPAIFAQRGAM
jgi:hypothetical protein